MSNLRLMVAALPAALALQGCAPAAVGEADSARRYDRELQTTAALHHEQTDPGAMADELVRTQFAATSLTTASAPAGEYRHLHYRQVRSLLISLGASSGGSAVSQLDALAKSLGVSDYALGVRTDLKLTAAKVKDFFRVTESACSEIANSATARGKLFPQGLENVDTLWVSVLGRYPTQEERDLAKDLAAAFNRTNRTAYVGLCVLALNSLEGVGQ